MPPIISPLKDFKHNKENNTMENKDKFVNDVNELFNIMGLYLKECPYNTFTQRMICIDYTKKFGIEDIKGFIKWCIDNNNTDSIEFTLYHDFGGIKDEGMLPRTSGYAKYNV